MAAQGFWRRVQTTLLDPITSNYWEAEGTHDKGALITLSAQGAATVNGSDINNPNCRGVQLVVRITAISGTTPTLTVTIQGKDAASGQYYTLLASTALNATGTTLLTVYPGAATTANASAPQVLPAVWRVIAVVAGTGPSVTATIGANAIY